jgi:hypothetical protein
VLETNVELQQHYPSLFFSMPIFVVQNSLVMYTCACAAVGPPYIIICFIHMYSIINYFLLFILVRFIIFVSTVYFVTNSFYSYSFYYQWAPQVYTYRCIWL